jgi:hypothetical protein
VYGSRVVGDDLEDIEDFVRGHNRDLEARYSELQLKHQLAKLETGPGDA